MVVAVWLWLFGCCSDGCGGWMTGMVGLRGWWLLVGLGVLLVVSRVVLLIGWERS